MTTGGPLTWPSTTLSPLIRVLRQPHGNGVQCWARTRTN